MKPKQNSEAAGTVQTGSDPAVAPSTPCSVSLTQREVIENKLLTALEDESCTAILTSKEDLEILIAALESWNWGNSSTHRSMDLAAGITQLRDEAFPPLNAKSDAPT